MQKERRVSMDGFWKDCMPISIVCYYSGKAKTVSKVDFG